MSYELTPQERSAARAALIKAGISTRGLSNDDLAREYNRLDRNEQPAPQQPQQQEQPEMNPAQQPQQAADLGAQIAALIAANMQQPAPAMDEAKIIELIEVHATKRLEIQPRDNGRPVVIEGAHKSLQEVVTWLSTGTNVFLVGPAGSGKTTLAEQAAEALKLPFFSSGAIMASYELLGVRNAHGEYIGTPLRQAFEHGGVFLLDELDSCSARALICFNQLLANNTFTFPDGMIKKHKDFVVVGGANTTGQGATRQYVARAEIDKSTLDRFIQVDIDYDLELEKRLAEAEYKAHGGTNRGDLLSWVKRVVATRTQLTKQNSTALITPRASIFGARGLANGLTIEQLTASILHKHLSDDQRAQLRHV